MLIFHSEPRHAHLEYVQTFYGACGYSAAARFCISLAVNFTYKICLAYSYLHYIILYSKSKIENIKHRILTHYTIILSYFV